MKKKKVSKPRVVRTRNAFSWTESQYFGRLRNSLRRCFRYWKVGLIALEAASRPYRGKSKLQKKEFCCNSCKNWFKRTDVEIDHIIECGSLRCYEDIVPFIQRLTPEDPKSFQILCKSCHKAKTLKTKQEKNG